ncbi:hypothetical protein [Streptomyces halstedii]|uniref:hypothetical protein n=1 Tax=Streptomyces halstedii TaxID=1944 RepID=UPI00334B39E9
MTLRPISPEMVERNRELLAERLRWPDGALEDCRLLEELHPGWHVWFDRGSIPTKPDPRYRAEPPPWPRREGLSAPTASELSELIRQAE